MTRPARYGTRPKANRKTICFKGFVDRLHGDTHAESLDFEQGALKDFEQVKKDFEEIKKEFEDWKVEWRKQRGLADDDDASQRNEVPLAASRGETPESDVPEHKLNEAIKARKEARAFDEYVMEMTQVYAGSEGKRLLFNRQWQSLLIDREQIWDHAETLSWSVKKPFDDRHGNRQNTQYEKPAIVEVVLMQGRSPPSLAP